MTGIQMLNLPALWETGTNIAAANQKNRLAALALGQAESQGHAQSVLYGGLDPKTGVTWMGGRPNLPAEEQNRLFEQAYPKELAAARIKALYPDPKDSFVGDQMGGLWELPRRPGDKPVRHGGGPAYTLWDGTPVGEPTGAPPTAPPAAETPGAKLAAVAAPDFRTARRRFETGGSASPNTAQNPNSTAQGPDQFVEETWLEQLRKYAPGVIEATVGPNANLKDPNVRAALLRLREDDGLSNAMAEGLARDNKPLLEAAGIEPNVRNLVVAHFLGGAGAARFLKADPNALAVDHVSRKAAASNREAFYDKYGRPRTVGEVLQFVDQRIAQEGGAAPPGTPPGTPPATPAATPTATTPPPAGTTNLQPMRNRKGELDTEFGWDPNAIDPRTGKPGMPVRYPPRNTTNINLNTDAAADKAHIEANLKRFDAFRQKGEQAPKLLGQLDQLQSVLKTMGSTGPATPLLMQLRGWAEQFGVPRELITDFWKSVTGKDLGNPEDAAVVHKLANAFVASSLKATFGNQITNMDTDIVMQTVPGITNQTQANEYIIDQIIRPQLVHDRDLWKTVRPLQRTDKRLETLDDVVYDFEEKHRAAGTPPPPSQTQQTPPAAPETPAPAGQPQPIRSAAELPDAKDLGDGTFDIAHPDLPGQRVQVRQTPAGDFVYQGPNGKWRRVIITPQATAPTGAAP